MEQNIHLPGLNHNGIRSGSFSGSSRLFRRCQEESGVL